MVLSGGLDIRQERRNIAPFAFVTVLFVTTETYCP
jgi:hypothetical protein